ncbi:acyltransferase domain-containing protein [Mycobacterium sp. B14F4]|uniref:acyltransferase domain-containing protein n=1 Tax=Mycobacterium sp. B14F4 TaxID=3153565 RepID=UPI00325C55BB
MPVVARRRKGRDSAQQGDRSDRRNRWHGFDPSVGGTGQFNGPSSTAVSGETAALGKLMDGLEREAVPAERIPVDFALHTADVEAVRETVRASLRSLQPRTGEIAVISSVTGAELDGSILDGEYWYANLRQKVLFEQAVRWAHVRGYHAFIECTPHPVLASCIQESRHVEPAQRCRVPARTGLQ